MGRRHGERLDQTQLLHSLISTYRAQAASFPTALLKQLVQALQQKRPSWWRSEGRVASTTAREERCADRALFKEAQ